MSRSDGVGDDNGARALHDVQRAQHQDQEGLLPPPQPLGRQADPLCRGGSASHALFVSCVLSVLVSAANKSFHII